MGNAAGTERDRHSDLAVLATQTVRSDTVLRHIRSRLNPRAWVSVGVGCRAHGMFNPEFLATDNSDGQAGNSLIQYLQDQSPDTLQRVAKSASNDIQDIIRHNVQGLLGVLPGEHFEVKVTANRDNLANMLASAMMTGYFLRQMEQRKELEETLFADEQMAVEDDELNL